MLHSLFSPNLSFLELTIRGLVVYFFILFMLRLSGKKQLAQLSPVDFVALLLISNAVQNSMNGGDNSLVGGLLLGFVILFSSVMISILSYRFKKVRSFFQGTPSLMIYKSEIQRNVLKKERITQSELLSMLRHQGIHSLKEIHTAILESDGTLSVFKDAVIHKE